ncbi:MAG: hypothetical protein V3V26_02010, partial [Candidatus Aenigmarchaeota archaeon]
MPTAYTGMNYAKAVARAVMGVFLAFVIAGNLDWGLFLIAIAAFVFIPLPNENWDRTVNMFLTGAILILILLWFHPFELSFGAAGGWEQFGTVIGAICFAVAMVLGALRLAVGFGGRREAELAIAAGNPPPPPPISHIGMTLMLVGSGLFMLLFLLFMQPWNWPFWTILFFAGWAIAMVGGLGGSATGNWSTKAATGIVLLVITLLIFTAGPGTQQIGSAFFGQLWPDVYTMGGQIFGPIGAIFGQVQTQLGGGLEMLTNPTAFAQRIMNGSYQRDPSTGLAGAYGVEMEEIRITPIYIQQPYQMIIKLNNRGAYDAKGISVKLSPGEKAPKGMDMEAMGILQPEQKVRDMPKGYIEQVIYPKGTDTAVISCENYNSYNLYEKSLIYKTEITYNYSIDSSMGLEFISEDEWSRLASEGRAITTRKKPATLKNAPVQLNIDTLEQPIREDTGHFIGLTLTPSQTGGKITDASIHLEMPYALIKNVDTATWAAADEGTLKGWIETRKD